MHALAAEAGVLPREEAGNNADARKKGGEGEFRGRGVPDERKRLPDNIFSISFAALVILSYIRH